MREANEPEKEEPDDAAETGDVLEGVAAVVGTEVGAEVGAELGPGADPAGERKAPVDVADCPLVVAPTGATLDPPEGPPTEPFETLFGGELGCGPLGAEAPLEC
jgi:hypothetical protein